MRVVCTVAFAFAAVAFGACAREPASTAGTAARISVVTTFSTLNSFVEAVGGDRVQVHSLVPVGASPENYQATPQDIGTLSRARVLVENGAGIETWLQRTIGDAKNPQLRIAVMTRGITLKGTNPHAWMDPVLAKHYVEAVRKALSDVDPHHTAQYADNARRYDARLDALRVHIAREIATVSPQHRTMIVFHNAWQYYNDRFGIKTIGVIELSPGQDPNPQYIAHLTDLARSNHVRAVFAEPEYSPKLAQTLAKSAGIKTVENLYDDSVSNSAYAHDYLSMMRYDTATIVAALK